MLSPPNSTHRIDTWPFAFIAGKSRIRCKVPGEATIQCAGSASGRHGLSAAALGLLALCLAGCAVGPDWKRPLPPTASRYTETPLADSTGSAPARAGLDQHFVGGADVPGEWWQMFRSPELTTLVARALQKNPSLAAAADALRAAQENTLAQEGGWLPQLSAQFNRTRTEFGLGEEGLSRGVIGLPATFSIYDAQVNVSYTFDVWGQNARSVEADRAAAEAQAFTLEGAVNMLAANTATAAITAASLIEQIKAEKALVEAERQLLKTVRSQFELGGATGTDVATQEAQLGNTEALVVPLQIQLGQTRDQLAAYVGRVPAEAAIPTITLDQLTLPGDLPVSLPSRLVDQRPDIRNAEAQLHEATANIGVAVSNRLPQITLTGSVGSEPARIGNLFGPGNGELNLLTQALTPVFEGGTLLHKQRQAVASARQAADTYRNTVITAFQNVADVLTALSGDAQALQANQRAERAAARSLGLARMQYGAGGVAYLTVLTAQTQYQNAVIGLIKAEAARYTDTVALFAALGGGWWNRNDLPKPPENLLRSLLP
jgi:NodT family efflux transporter outer membrane factor (OMF) lipoprotein